MGAVDMQIAVPFTLVALLVLSIFGSSLPVMICLLGVAYWEQYARIVRGEVRKITEMPFIEAARASGGGPRYIALRHVLPNIVSPLVVQFTLSLSNIVILESTLSFLGLGVQPPTATLGSMVGYGRDYMPNRAMDGHRTRRGDHPSDLFRADPRRLAERPRRCAPAGPLSSMRGRTARF